MAETSDRDAAQFEAQSADLLGTSRARAFDTPQAARDLADALASPVVRLLFKELVAEAIREERARMLAEQAPPTPMQRPEQRGSDRTSWVGRKAAAEAARNGGGA